MTTGREDDSICRVIHLSTAGGNCDIRWKSEDPQGRGGDLSGDGSDEQGSLRAPGSGTTNLSGCEANCGCECPSGAAKSRLRLIVTAMHAANRAWWNRIGITSKLTKTLFFSIKADSPSEGEMMYVKPTKQEKHEAVLVFCPDCGSLVLVLDFCPYKKVGRCRNCDELIELVPCGLRDELVPYGQR